MLADIPHAEDVVDVCELASGIEVGLRKTPALAINRFEGVWTREREFVGTDPHDWTIALMGCLDGLGFAKPSCR